MPYARVRPKDYKSTPSLTRILEWMWVQRRSRPGPCTDHEFCITYSLLLVETVHSTQRTRDET